MTIDLDDSREVCELINSLTQDEGSSVGIVAPNADFGGPNNVILVRDLLGVQNYYGESVLDCLRKAEADK